MNTLRGSEWRRWDLHIHTPSTQKNDCYKGSTIEEKWEHFYKKIAEYIGAGENPDKSIAAIGITDYLSTDNYFKVKDDKRLPETVKLILPNIEMRIIPIARKTPVNIHFIFDPSFDSKIESRFLSKIKFRGSREYTASKSELIALGRDVNSDQTLNEIEAYKVGIDKFVPSLDSIIDVFDGDAEMRDKTIIALSNSSSDGVSGIREHEAYLIGTSSQLTTVCQAMYLFCDAIFSGKPSDINYFLGDGVDSQQAVREKCGSLKPCIHGSDAHELDKLFEPDKQRYCWIKSDPTFEGLKQILVEPRDRVRIQATIPDAKQYYNVIDYVEILNDENFSKEPIYFSDNLTCIVGGKSTGKSLLLHNIALAIDPMQVKKKIEIAVSNVKRIKGMKVVWKDGHISDGNETTDRKIVYIPQAYLNRLSDERETTTEIDKIIEDIVLQNMTAEYAYKNSNDEISEYKEFLAKTIMDYCVCVNQIEHLSAELLDLGLPESITKEIDRLKNELEQISIQTDITEQDIQRYQEAAEGVKVTARAILDIQSEIDHLKSMINVLDNSKIKIDSLSIYREKVSGIINNIIEQANIQWATQLEQLELLMLKDIEVQVKNKGLYDAIISELKPKIDGHERISTLSKQIVDESQKLENSKELTKQINDIQQKQKTILELLTHSIVEFRKIHEKYSNEVNNNLQIQTKDLEFSLEVVFKLNQFESKLRSILNNRSFSHFSILKDDLQEEMITESFLESLITSIASENAESLQLKGGYSLESALRDIINDWFTINYVVKMDNDPIGMMSPGKKALVLLRLLISLAESRNPILLDQPEDDLDNRSIFDELITFIKAKKTNRQIIIVTHNANIVLGGDSEQIIVANQKGKDSPNKEYRFEYRSGAIENIEPIFSEQGELENGVLNKCGIQAHICEILEGGEQAFDLRRNKYRFIQ